MTYTTSRQRRINKHARNQLARLIVHYIGITVGTSIIALFFSFVIINWLSGCGERFPTMDGGYVQGECISPLDLFRDEPRTEESTQ
jgi:hypothetical protein